MKIKSTFTTTNIILIMLVANLMFTGGIFSYTNYSVQFKQQIDVSTNNTAQEIKNLIKAIQKSDDMDDNHTENLLKTTVTSSLRNYLAVLNSTNQTITLLKFLSDNFGATSGYLEKENFQYEQANKTFDFLEQALVNQKEIMKLLANQTR